MDKTDRFYKVAYKLTFGRRYLAVCLVWFIFAAYMGINVSGSNILLHPYAFWVAFVFMLVYGISYTIAKRKRVNPCFRSLFLTCFVGIFVFIAGFGNAVYTRREYEKKEKFFDNQTEIYARVMSEPTLSDSKKTKWFYGEVIKTVCSGTESGFKKPCGIMVYYPVKGGDEVLKDRIVCISDYKNMSSPPSYKGGFDYARYLRQGDIYYVCYGKSVKDTDIIYDGDLPWLLKAGEGIKNTISKSCDLKGYSDDNKGLLQGILIGDKSKFTEEAYNNLSNSGFMHIAAVSGMHVSYLMLLISWLFAETRLPRRTAVFLIVPCLIIFASVSDFTPSVLRAVIMASVASAAILARRKSDGITTIAVAAAVLAASNPYMLENISFLLSFGATAGILIYYKKFKAITDKCVKRMKCKLSAMRDSKEIPQMHKGNDLFKKIAFKGYAGIVSSVCLSASASVGIVYFMAKSFGCFQWGGILGNILVVPATGVIFVAGIINSVLYAVFPFAADILAMGLDVVLGFVNLCAKVFSKEVFKINLPVPKPTFFLVYLVICIGLYIILDFKNNKNEKQNL